MILGSGRSGTSMVAGALSKAGYFMGDKFYPGRDSNPKGFFETREINKINEELLGMVSPRRPKLFGKWFFRDRPAKFQKWLARIPLATKIPVPPPIIGKRIQKLIQRGPFCFKDPRFSYTLPAWRPFLKNTVFVCVFRKPEATVQSILKECRNEKYLHNLSITEKQAMQVWILMYKHILDIHRHKGEWLFLHFNQVLEREGLDKLAKFTGAEVDYNFPDVKLRRSQGSGECCEEARECYLKLCELASYDIVKKI